VADGPVRCFRSDTKSLKRMVQGNSDFWQSLIEALGIETHAKLNDSNARVAQSGQSA
jgi:hypothetical protein